MSVQDLQELFEGTDASSDNDDSNDEDYRSDDDQPQGRGRPRRRVNESDEEKEEEKVDPRRSTIQTDPMTSKKTDTFLRTTGTIVSRDLPSPACYMEWSHERVRTNWSRK